METRTPEEYLQEHAPDIKIIEPKTPLHGALKDFDYDTFGPEFSEKVHDMVNMTIEWLSNPLLSDEAADDTVRIEREDSFPTEVSTLLKSSKSHPDNIQLVAQALGVLLDYDRKMETDKLDTKHFSNITKILDEYRILTSLRVHLHDTETQVWTTVLSILSGDEINTMMKDPHPFINEKIEELVHRLEAIAFLILQRLEKKG